MNWERYLYFCYFLIWLINDSLFIKQLWFAALTGNYVEMLRCIAWGSSVNWVDNDEEGRTALHALPAAGTHLLPSVIFTHTLPTTSLTHLHKIGGDVICMELILQNGGEVNMLDHRGRTP